MTMKQTFLPWVRQGPVAAVTVADTLDDSLPTEAAMPLRVHLNAGMVPVDLRLRGPGDVIGIDRDQVIRTEPVHGANGFPPNYFASLEFDRPDFPWLFTPARAEDVHGRLRPWVTLIVVRKQPGVALRAGADGKCAVLEIDSPANAADELPDLAESWAWAHAQALTDGNDLETALSERPTRNASRLVCPRRLASHGAYYACVVPTFELGRKAGLGLAIDEADRAQLAPAWGAAGQAPASVVLPVYYHFEFSTGERGDFESLAAELKARALEPGVGARTLHVGDAGVDGMPDIGQFPVAGVFRSPTFDPPAFPRGAEGPADEAWQDSVRERVNATANAASGASEEAVVGPPIYGRHHQALRSLPDDGWLNQLNLDPRHRGAAGLGVLLVQAQQDALMHSAWEQLGDLATRANAARNDELAAAVNRSAVARRFVPAEANEELFYQMTGSAHSRLRVGPGETVEGWGSARGLPKPATAATLRRLARPGGPTQRRLRAGDSPPPSQPIGALGVRDATAAPVPEQPAPAARPLGERTDALERTLSAWASAADTDAGARGRKALEALIAQLATVPVDVDTSGGSRRLLPTSDDQAFPPSAVVLGQLDPDGNPSAPQDRLLNLAKATGEEGSTEAEPPVLEHPRFPQPMVEGLRQFMPELLLAGADGIEDNSVVLLETNPKFIESFMVGLNHEMSRELLWRGFPTDQRGTCFGHFWGNTTEENLERAPDIAPLNEWSRDVPLGGNLADGHVDGQLVLVVRAELLRRFPNAVIYAAKMTPEGGLDDVERMPLHRGQLTDDAVFLLFDITEAEARGTGGNDGYCFVLQEQPGEARFGFDLDQWPDIATGQGGHVDLAANAEEGADWTDNAASVAATTLQRRYRVAIHARRLLPKLNP